MLLHIVIISYQSPLHQLLLLLPWLPPQDPPELSILVYQKAQYLIIMSSQFTTTLLVFKPISVDQRTISVLMTSLYPAVSLEIFNEYLKIYISKVNSRKALLLYRSSLISLNALKSLGVFLDLEHSLISHHLSFSQSSWPYCH